MARESNGPNGPMRRDWRPWPGSGLFPLSRRAAAWLMLIIGFAVAATVGLGYVNATADPIVRHLRITVPGYPVSARPTRIILLSDLHVESPDMPPARVRHIVDRINALGPDIDLIAGDYLGGSSIGQRYSPADAVAPLGRLKARLGVFAILGNNDADASAFARAFRAGGIRLLMNEAVEAGPIAIGGLDGRLAHTDQWAIDLARRRTYDALDRLPGVKILVAHRPDEIVPAPAAIRLVLAGHTHCGQIVLPLAGAFMSGSDYGTRYLCGMHRRGSTVLVVTAGLGTSHIPIRFGAPPDIWVISVAGVRSQR